MSRPISFTQWAKRLTQSMALNCADRRWLALAASAVSPVMRGGRWSDGVAREGRLGQQFQADEGHEAGLDRLAFLVVGQRHLDRRAQRGVARVAGQALGGQVLDHAARRARG